MDDIKENEHKASAIVGDITGGRFFDKAHCGYCGADLGGVQDIAICDACDQHAEAVERNRQESRAKRREAARTTVWETRSGEYAGADPAKLPSDLMRQLHDRWSITSRRGATIAGNGGGKSWLLWLLLRKCYDQAVEFEHRDATEVRSELIAIGRHGDSSPVVRRLCNVRVLAIDNFGLNKSTEAADELWLHILETRTKHRKPTLIASPYSAGSLVARFSDHTMGCSIVKRIGTQHNWVLDATNNRLTPSNA